MDWISLSLRWFLALWLMGWLALPLWYRVLGRLPDGGLAVGRILTPALASLPLFWLASFHILPLRTAPLFLILPLIGSASLLADSARRERFLRYVREHRKGLLWSDAIFTLAFGLFLWVRLRHPELNSLEKPMDSAMLHELLRVDYLPFDSFWFSGTPFTNYYYYGQFICANLARTLGVHAPYVYNLCFPLWSAFFLSALWPLCASLCTTAKEAASYRPAYARGLVATVIIGLMGNFEPLRQFHKTDTWTWWPLDWWTTTRIIDGTINEYPAFTITVGDLHAHFFGLTFNAIVATLCYALFLGRKPLYPTVTEDDAAASVDTGARPSKKQQKAAAAAEERARQLCTERAEAEQAAAAESETGWFVLLLILGALVGVMYMTNTWDLPLATLLIMSSAVLTRPNRKIESWLWVIMPPVLGYLFSWPYRRLFKMPLSAPRLDLLKPPFLEFLMLWGFLLCLAAFGFWNWFQRRDSPVRRGEGNFGLLLTLLGLMGVVLPYIVYIQSQAWTGMGMDHLNIVFKVGLQACVLLGIAGACGTLAAWAEVPNGWHPMGLLKWASPGIFIVPLMCSACVLWTWAVRDASHDENGDTLLSLNGERFLSKNDQGALEWIRSNVRPGEAVLEADLDGQTYNRFGRVACLTGVPTAVCWWQHLRQFGATDAEIQGRYALLTRVYTWTTPDDALAALRELKGYGVHYIFVGEVERQVYPASGLSRLRATLGAVYENGDTFIAVVP